MYASSIRMHAWRSSFRDVGCGSGAQVLYVLRTLEYSQARWQRRASAVCVAEALAQACRNVPADASCLSSPTPPPPDAARIYVLGQRSFAALPESASWVRKAAFMMLKS